MYSELRTFFVDNDNGGQTDMAALAIRLVFHDAASFNATGNGEGGMHAIMRLTCNGNICERNFDDNRGLGTIIEALAPMYQLHATELSNADYWALAGTVAVDYTSGRNNPRATLVPFRWGRIDHPIQNSITGRVDAEGGWNEVKRVFVDRYGFTPTETVALIGAHTLGRMHRQNSGYDGPWVRNTRSLDNAFYRDLISTQRSWTYETRTSPTGNTIHQWEAPGNRNMLNTDMCIVRDIDVDVPTNGQTVDHGGAYTRNTETFAIVQRFADNNNDWLISFGGAFAKLMDLGYTCLDLPGETTCGSTPPPPTTDTGGFDWGENCEAGSGNFVLNLPTANTYANVGVIPPGKFGVRVRLSAVEDLDITLFDTEDTSQFAEGRAIVAWCGSADCNRGVLAGSNEAQAVYSRPGIADMTVRYSGYNGVNGARGTEWVEILGETSTPLMMRAFAFRAGSATVDYEWAFEESPCCLGQSPCTGSFTQQILQGSLIDVGQIPVGKLSVNIQLLSAEDVDIQIYDLEDTSSFSEGQAIVAWCGSPNCNSGSLNGAGADQTLYPPTTAEGGVALYEYSGYNGVNGVKGDEYIRVDQTTRTLMMKAFGYRAGTAAVNYSFMNPPRTATSRGLN